jgi:ligand-binding SRPBCC domain-containing protein
VPHAFETEQWVAAPREQVFRFFSDPRNLHLLFPPYSEARLKTVRLVPPHLPFVAGSGQMAGIGSEITISFRLLPHFPLRAAWTARIVEFEWLRHFRDLEVSGPFESFDHTHAFGEASLNGKPGTIIHDRIVYEVGVGPMGVIANGLFVRLMLRQLFEYRHQAAARALGSG